MNSFKPVALCLAVTFVGAREAHAQQWLLSANENKVSLVDGVVTVQNAPSPDSVSLFDISGGPPRLVTQIDVPVSVVGPPNSITLAPDLSLALVSATTRIDPNDKTKTTDGNQLSVIDLKTFAVVQTLTVGPAPAGVAVSPDGKLALLITRTDSTVTVFAIENKRLRETARLALPEKSTPGNVAFTPDGKRALVTRDGDNAITVLAIDGENVTLAGRDFYTGLRPYGLAVASSGAFAVVGNVGKSQGDNDTIALVDLEGIPRAVHHATAGPTVEGIAISPDSKLVAAVVQNGSNRPATSPFFNERGYVVLLRLERGKLEQLGTAPIGKWSQGAAFSADSRHLYVQNVVERDIQVFRVDQRRPYLFDTGRRIKLPGGGAALAAGSH